MDADTEKSFLSLIIGKTVKITTINGCFQGVLMNVDAERTVTLIKVRNLTTGKAERGAKLIFGCTVLNVEPAEELENVTQEAKVFLESDDILSQQMSLTSPQEVTTRLLQSLKRAVENEDVMYTVIDSFQTLFGPAIRDLQNQKVVSVSAVGQNISCHGKLCWLQVASKNHVYLFDILALGSGVFKNGLQVLLEDKDILKVIHDCRWLADILSNQYSVLLCNIFDTQVADVYLFSMETGGFLPHHISTMKNCLIRHLNIPASRVDFLTYKETLMKDNLNIWIDRPVPPVLLKVLALDVKYILNLRLAMLDAMFSDFRMLVDCYLNTYLHGAGDVFGSTEMSCSELPKEFKQLLVLQQIRREKALKQYSVNRQGLLIREEEEKQLPFQDELGPK